LKEENLQLITALHNIQAKLQKMESQNDRLTRTVTHYEKTTTELRTIILENRATLLNTKERLLQMTQNDINTSDQYINLCSICYETIIDIPYVTKCQHVYHTECLSQWIEHSPTCPYCNSTVNMEADT
jgi:hypothetical protein